MERAKDEQGTIPGPATCRPHEIDNRDTLTTWLWIDKYGSKEGYIEVDPWDLVENTIENAGLSEELEDKFLTELRQLKERVGLAEAYEANNWEVWKMADQNTEPKQINLDAVMMALEESNYEAEQLYWAEATKNEDDDVLLNKSPEERFRDFINYWHIVLNPDMYQDKSEPSN